VPRGLRGGVGWVGKGTKAASMRKPCTLSDCCSLCTRDMNSCTPPSSPRRASMGRWVGSRGSNRLQMISRMSCRSSESGQSPTKDTTACKCHMQRVQSAKCKVQSVQSAKRAKYKMCKVPGLEAAQPTWFTQFAQRFTASKSVHVCFKSFKMSAFAE